MTMLAAVPLALLALGLSPRNFFCDRGICRFQSLATTGSLIEADRSIQTA